MSVICKTALANPLPGKPVPVESAESEEEEYGDDEEGLYTDEDEEYGDDEEGLYTDEDEEYGNDSFFYDGNSDEDDYYEGGDSGYEEEAGSQEDEIIDEEAEVERKRRDADDENVEDSDSETGESQVIWEDNGNGKTLVLFVTCHAGYFYNYCILISCF